jgi:hypothetical protein
MKRSITILNEINADECTCCRSVMPPCRISQHVSAQLTNVACYLNKPYEKRAARCLDEKNWRILAQSKILKISWTILAGGSWLLYDLALLKQRCLESVPLDVGFTGAGEWNAM